MTSSSNEATTKRTLGISNRSNTPKKKARLELEDMEIMDSYIVHREQIFEENESFNLKPPNELDKPAEPIINIGAGVQIQKVISNVLLDGGSLKAQIEEIGSFKTEHSGGVSHSALIPASTEPDGVSWKLGLGTILPGEIEKLKKLSFLHLVQSAFKHIELAKHQIAQLGILNEDIDCANRALMVEVEKLRVENENLSKLNAEIAIEKENILKDNDDLCLLNKNMENTLQAQIEEAKKAEFEAGYALGYRQRNKEVLTYLGHPTNSDTNFEL